MHFCSVYNVAFQKGMKLPGSRKDIIRTQKLSGPSPVGGSTGGTEGKTVMSLDEFEIQAAHYNIACACARLGKVTEVRSTYYLDFFLEMKTILNLNISWHYHTIYCRYHMFDVPRHVKILNRHSRVGLITMIQCALIQIYQMFMGQLNLIL